jgi:hypothetical protein
MFTHERAATIAIAHVVGIDKQGEAVPIPPDVVAKGEVLQAKVMISRTIRDGRQATEQMCSETATELASMTDWSQILQLEVRRDRYKVAGYFSGDHSSIKSKVFARCPIERRP